MTGYAPLRRNGHTQRTTTKSNYFFNARATSKGLSSRNRSTIVSPNLPFTAALIVLHLSDVFHIMLSTKFCFLAMRYFENMTRILDLIIRNQTSESNITVSHGGKLNCRSVCKD